ncbi:hypothetical protein BH09VER1_BH09VER1_08020 [soil metagenome]
MTVLPDLWTSSHGYLHRDRLVREAMDQARGHALPVAREEIAQRLGQTKARLVEKLRLAQPDHPLTLEFHGDISLVGYTIRRLSFDTAPGVRMTGNLYVPDGAGPFPAVLNLHGHWPQGKICAHIQARGHILARSGIVTLSVDAAGSGERSEIEREWSYHGASKAAEMFLNGDSLLGLQVRENRKALDVLQSLGVVDSERIGATGASGGGNQTMWLAALDERVKVAVPVVSVGSFQAYVGARNCLCETLPGGLEISEEWGVLGLIAPRPLLVINAIHDQPAFHYEAMSPTCRQVQEIYALYGRRECFDSRLIDMVHGYCPPALHAMLGWMRHWLSNVPGQAGTLPGWNAIPEDDLLCYPSGERPSSVGYLQARQTLSVQSSGRSRQELAELVGWTSPTAAGPWIEKGPLIGAITSPRGIPMPVLVSGDWGSLNGEIQVILSPAGKKSSFVLGHYQKGIEKNAFVMAIDLPGVGELAWETDEVAGARLHDTSRACLWLGYSLAIEWAEAITAICLLLRAQFSEAEIQIIAEKEMVFGSILGLALHPVPRVSLVEFDCPQSLRDLKGDSLVWYIPNFQRWGDLDSLRALAGVSQFSPNS